MSTALGEQPLFQRVAENSAATLYERAASPGSWFAFVAFATEQPAELAFTDAWRNYLGNPLGGQNGGAFIVALTRPADPVAYLSAFSDVISAYNQKYGGFAYRYVMFGDPTSTVAGALIAAVAFATSAVDQPGFVQREITIAARNVGIVVAQNAYIELDEESSSLRFAPNGTAGILLVSNKYDSRNLNVLDTDVLLAFDGPSAGLLRFGLTLNVTADPSNDDFTLLDVGLKYFTQRTGLVFSQRYPLFGPTVDGSPVGFAVKFDPLHPLAHERTAFVFRGVGEGPCVAMESGLRDGFGHPVRLTPLAGAAALVLQQDTVSLDTSGAVQLDFYYFVPSGSFTLLPGVSDPPAKRVMAGLSPLETIVFDPPGATVVFHPDRLAFSPLLSDLSIDANTPRLTDRYLTAWPAVTAAATHAVASDPVYLAQPEGAALYGPGNDVTMPYLEHQETPAAVLRDASAEGSFPLVPYGQIIFDAHSASLSAADVARLERDVLAVERRVRIAKTGSKPTASRVGAFALGAATRVMTPQGFVVDLAADGSGTWTALHLAQTSWSPDPAKTPPTVTALAFENVDDTLRGAFQTNQQFLVISQPRAPWNLSALPGTTFDDELRPQGWPFNIATGKGSYQGQYRNVLLFKFCDGAAEARIDDWARWTAASDFNTDPGDVAAWLRAYLENAKALAKGPDGAYFQRFVEAMTTPSWRGILAMRVDVDASALPQELRGLAAGIDLDAFYAHHVGVDLSFVDASGGALEPQGNSSVFATVYYVDATYAAGLAAGGNPDLPIPVVGAPDYAFRVLTLKTLFVNAEIAAFASKSQVTLNRIFGDQTVSLTLNGVPAPSNSLVLDGTYENHSGVGVYVFATNADARFMLVSNLWRSFEVVKATFSTLRAPSQGAVLSRFSLRGFLDFATITIDDGTGPTPFDLLSFGGDGAGTDATGTGLSFAELHLDMTFDTASPGSPSFAFSTDQMTFAPAVEQARPASFYARMPITLSGIVAGTGAPNALGFLTVNVLSLQTDPLGDAWFGLQYTLDLGTAGGLAAKAGFTARLLIAWGPQSQGNGVRVFVGLALPGAGGTSRGLSLQGVLRLTVDRLLLYRDATASTFVLRLTNVALSLLGIALPPGTSTAFIVFGNPDPQQRDAVGWYAAINREKKDSAPALTGEH